LPIFAGGLQCEYVINPGFILIQHFLDCPFEIHSLEHRQNFANRLDWMVKT